MEILPLIVNPSSKAWSLACLIIILTILVATTLKTILSTLYDHQGWKIVKNLAPSISNLVYIFGLKIAAQLAPLNTEFEKWVEGGLYILTIFLFMLFAQKASITLTEWSIRQIDHSETLRQGFLPLIRNLTTLFIFFCGTIMILNHFHYDAMSLITAFGVSSLAVGLAAKETLSNMISGFILIIDRNLRPGDSIVLGTSSGKVKEIGLRSTQLSLEDGNTLIVPNTELVNTKILNLSLSSHEKMCSIQIRVPFSIPFSQVKTHCLLILDKINKVSKQKPKTVTLSLLAEGFQSIQITFWVSRLEDMKSAITEFNEQTLLKAHKKEIDLFSPPK
jgi:small-conductance mechanosensitive channel